MTKLLGPDLEPYKSIELVEKYRQYWRPDNVRVILLAESHVFTSRYDSKCNIKKVSLPRPNYPTKYAKFVYCLACGEDSLIKRKDHPAENHGTPQFWKILFSCVNEIKSNASFSSVLKKNNPESQRIGNKIELLESLRKNGIWLVDASIMALYNKGKKPSNKIMDQAIRTSWLGYTRNIVLNANPGHVIVVGKGVAKALCSELIKLNEKKILVNIIEQPNAHLSAGQHLANFRTCYRLCMRGGKGTNKALQRDKS